MEGRSKDQELISGLEIHYSNVLACQFCPFDSERFIDIGDRIWSRKRARILEAIMPLFGVLIRRYFVLMRLQPNIIQCGSIHRYFRTHRILRKF